MTVTEFFGKFGIKVDEASFKKANSAVNDLKNFAAKALGVIGIGISLNQLRAISEEFNAINDRITYAAGEVENIKDVQRDILQAANNSKVSYSQMADAVTSLKQANAEVFPLDEAAEFVEYINKLGMAAGYSEGEIASMRNTIQRMTAFGTVSAQMLNRMAMQTPALIEQICKSLEITREELDSMAASGELTVETIKEAILGSKEEIDIAFNNLDYSISDAMLNIRNQWGFWVDEINSTYKITETIAKTMVKGFELLMSGLNKAKDGFSRLSDFVGGADHLLRLLAVAAGLFVLAMNWTKITAMANAFLKALKTIWVTFGTFKTLGIIALVLALYLIIEDFVYFLLGYDSVFGMVFDALGIGADNARETILKAFNAIKEFIVDTLSGIKKSFDEHIGPILKNLGRIGDSIGKVLLPILKELLDFGKTVFEGLFGTVDENVNPIVDLFDLLMRGIEFVTDKLADFMEWITSDSDRLGILQGAVMGAASAFMAFQLATNPVVQVIAVIGILIALGRKLFENWDTIKEKAGQVWDKVKEVWTGITDFFKGIWDAITGDASVLEAGISDPFTAAWNIIKGIWDAVTGFFSAIFGGIQGDEVLASLGDDLSAPFKAGYDIITNLFGGIKSKFSEWFSGIDLSAAGSKITSWASDTWSSIQDVFSGVTTWFKDKFSGAGDAIKEALGGAGQKAGEAIDGVKSAAGKAGGWFASLFSWGSEDAAAASGAESKAAEVGQNARTAISENLKGAVEDVSIIFEGVSEKVNSFIGNVLQNIPTALGETRASAQESWSEMQKDVETTTEQISQLVKQLLSQLDTMVKSGMAAIGRTVTTSINTMRTSVEQGLSSMVGAARTQMSNFTSAISIGMSNAETAARNGGNKIKSALSNISLRSVGADLIQGLINGIDSKSDSLNKTITSLTNKIKKVKSDLKINSPSKFMVEVGQGVGEGLQLGMKNSENSVERSAHESMSGPIMEEGRNIVNALRSMQRAANAGKVSTSTARLATGNSYSRNVSQNVSINNTFNGERAIQRKAEKIMDQSAQDITDILARGLAYAR